MVMPATKATTDVVQEYVANASLAIEIGDLMYHATDDARPASSLSDQGTEPLNQAAFAAEFLGVAVSARLASQDSAGVVRIQADGLYEMTCQSSTFEQGELVGASENGDGNGLLDQTVEKVTDPDLAIGVVQKRYASATTKVWCRLTSRKAWDLGNRLGGGAGGDALTGPAGVSGTDGTVGGVMSTTGGAGGTATSGTGGAGGAGTWAGGAGGTATTGTAGAGGASTTRGGVGGAASAAAGIGGTGGAAALTGGAGGASSHASGGANGVGGAAAVTGGAGGASGSSTAGGVGGAGGLAGGVGGAGAATGTGGAGGAVAIAGGAGGATSGAGTGGAGGSITVTPGAGGATSGGTNGAAGGIFLRSSTAMIFRQHAAAVAKTDGDAVMTAAEMINGIVVHTISTGRTLTTPTGAQISAGCPASLAVGDCFFLYVVTVGTGADDISTLTAGDGNVTFVGRVTIGPDAANLNGYGTFLFRNTATSTWVGYRVG